MDTDLGKVLSAESRGCAPSEWGSTKRAICAFGIAVGMGFMHEKNVIHRDLKVENVMLDENFYPRITDFGLSKILSVAKDQVNSMLHMTLGLGTPLYMAPELFADENDSPDPYTTSIDVYAYGMLLYELCTTAKPFKEKGEMQQFVLMNYIKEGQRPTIPSYVPRPFADLMAVCWSQNPRDRPTFKQIIDLMADRSFIYDDTDQVEYDEYVNTMLATLQH
jgi:serine/threonine protein kinase